MKLDSNMVQLISVIITTVIAPIALCFATGLVSLIRAKVTDTKMQSVLTDVDASISTSFASWMAKFDAAKARLSADGTFDDADLKEALGEAAISAANTLTVGTIGFLQTNGIHVVEYMQDKIKARLAEREEYKNE